MRFYTWAYRGILRRTGYFGLEKANICCPLGWPQSPMFLVSYPMSEAVSWNQLTGYLHVSNSPARWTCLLPTWMSSSATQYVA
jgi:hypothetical protein